MKGRGRPRSRRATRASWTGCPPAARRCSARWGPRSGPSTAWASSSTSRAPWRRQTAAMSATGATSPSMENTRSVTTMAGSGGPGQQGLEVVDVAVAVDGDVGARQAGPVDDRGVVELVGADAHPGVAEGAEHAEVGGEAGGEDDGPFAALATGPGPARARSWQGRLPVTRRLAPDPGPPAVEGLVGGGHHRRVGGQAQVVVGGEGHHLGAVVGQHTLGPWASKVTGRRQRPSAAEAVVAPLRPVTTRRSRRSTPARHSRARPRPAHLGQGLGQASTRCGRSRRR